MATGLPAEQGRENTKASPAVLTTGVQAERQVSRAHARASDSPHLSTSRTFKGLWKTECLVFRALQGRNYTSMKWATNPPIFSRTHKIPKFLDEPDPRVIMSYSR